MSITISRVDVSPKRVMPTIGDGKVGSADKLSSILVLYNYYMFQTDVVSEGIRYVKAPPMQLNTELFLVR